MITINDTAKFIWENIIRNWGPDAKYIAAAFIGNAQQESGINPACIDPPAYGCWQFQEDRESHEFSDYKVYASGKGKDWTDLATQLEFIIEKRLPQLLVKGYG